MKEIVNKFLLTGDKYMPEIHLRQPGFTYSAVSHIQKIKKKSKKLRKQGIYNIFIKCN